MEFGVHFQLPCAPGQSPVQRVRDTIEQAVEAEQLGYESVWPVESHFDAGPSIMSAPLLLLAAIAERTRTLRLGTAVLLLPLWHPLRIAEEIAVLDLLSNGRVECGVGRGMDPAHFTGFGVSPSESHDRLLEGIQVLSRAWTSERWSFDGAHHRFSDMNVEPKPVQRPHPPLRIAANSPETLEVAGGLGLPVMVAGHVNPLPTLPSLLSVYDGARRTTGGAPEPDDITLLVPVFVGESTTQIRHDVEPGLIRVLALLQGKVRSWLASRPVEPDHGNADPVRARLEQIDTRLASMTFDSFAETSAIWGTPDQCAERLEALEVELGIGRLIAWFNVGGVVPHHRVLTSMELFATEVMPQLARQRAEHAAA